MINKVNFVIPFQSELLFLKLPKVELEFLNSNRAACRKLETGLMLMICGKQLFRELQEKNTPAAGLLCC